MENLTCKSYNAGVEPPVVTSQPNSNRDTVSDARSLHCIFVEQELRLELIERLTLLTETGASPQAFMREVLEICVKQLRPFAGGMDLCEGTRAYSERYLPRSSMHEKERKDAKELIDVTLSRLLADDSARPRQRNMKLAGQMVALIMVPIRYPGSQRVKSVVAFAARMEDQEHQRDLLAALKIVADVTIALRSPSMPSSTAAGGNAANTVAARSLVSESRSAEGAVATVAGTNIGNANVGQTAVGQTGVGRELQLVKALEKGTLVGLATSLVNSICNRFHCEQVGFAMVVKGRARMEAVSGMAIFKANNPGIVDMRQAMEEMIDLNRRVACQPFGEADVDADSPIARQWSVRTGNSAVALIPLYAADKLIAILAIRRSGERPFAKKELDEIEKSIGSLVVAFPILERASRDIRGYFSETFGVAVQRVLMPNTISKRILLVAVIVAVLAIVIVPVPFQPICTAQVTAANLVKMSAPLTGRLESLLVRSGQAVSVGEPLVQFETSALQLELASTIAQRDAEAVTMREWLDKGDPEKAAIARAQMESLAARADYMNYQLAAATIVAPCDGVVVRCEIDKRVGAALQLGDPLLEFAPGGEWQVQIHVPESLATIVKAGQIGTFSAKSRPEIKVPLRIESMDGATTAVEGANVIVSKAHLNTDAEWLKIGMEGKVRIRTEGRSCWWMLTHTLWDSLRLNYWL